jgi:ribosome maturation factor RimP
MSTIIETVRALVEPLVEPYGIEVVDVEHAGALLRISLDFVDATKHIDLDTITTYSEQISDLLDLHDPIPGRYTLEVSSPGLERPLKTPDQFRRFVGTPVNVKTKRRAVNDNANDSDSDSERRFTGTLTEATDTHVTFDTPNGTRTLRYEDIDRAKTVFEWGPTPKPNAAPKQQQKTKTKKATTP